MQLQVSTSATASPLLNLLGITFLFVSGVDREKLRGTSVQNVTLSSESKIPIISFNF